MVKIKSKQLKIQEPQQAEIVAKVERNIFNEFDFIDAAVKQLSKQITIDKHDVIAKMELEKQFKIHCLFLFISFSILSILAIVLFMF